MNEYNINETTLMHMLKDAGIVKTRKENEKSFILKSGGISRFFFDVNEASASAKLLREIVNVIDYNLTEEGEWSDINFDIIGSVALGGVAIASVYSYISGINNIIVRAEKHDTGTETQILGNCIGKYVLLIEDVATTGGSIVKAVKNIRDEGGLCNDCIVVIDREEGAKELCDENNIDLHPILKKSDFGVIE